MKILSRGTIPKPVDDIRFNSITFPCIEILPSGRWLVTFKASQIKGDCAQVQSMMMWTDDEGETWSEPYQPVRLPDIDGVPGQCRISYPLSLGSKNVLLLCNWVDVSDTSKPYYDEKNETLKDTRIFYSFSKDQGLSWSEPYLMDTDPIIDPVPLTGQPFLLYDGTVVCHFEINKSIGDTSKWIHKSAMIFSKDGGLTWGDVAKVTEVPNMYYWDQRPNVMNDGNTIVNYFWALDGLHNRYLNIHSKISRDGGKTWSGFRDTQIYGQPGRPVELYDGRIATVDINRTKSPVITVRTCKGYDIPYDESLVVYDNNSVGQDSCKVSMQEAWQEMYRFSVGHPALLRLNDREMLAYYYTGENCDHTSIEYVRIQYSED